MSKLQNRQEENTLFNEISQLIEQCQRQVVLYSNSTLTTLFWQIGERINNEILHNKRADYAKQIVSTLSTQLKNRYGRNFEEKNLRRMLQFAEQFPDFEIVVPLARQLSWSHFLILIPIKNPEARLFYAHRAMSEILGKRELRKEIANKAFERRTIANLQNTSDNPALLDSFKDPYFLDFLGLQNTYLEKYKGQMELYLKWLNKHEKQEGENPPIGLILCAEGSREQIELLEMHKDGILVAEYWTELPPKKQLEQKIHSLLIEAKERMARNKALNPHSK